MKIFRKIIKNIQKRIEWFIPYGFIILRNKTRLKKNNYQSKLFFECRLKKEYEIKNHFLTLNTNDSEILEIVDFFKKGYGFSYFPYNFSRKYHAGDIDIFLDKDMGSWYINYEDKKLYFPEEWNGDGVRNYYNGLRIEQDNESPHRYESDEFVVRDGDVIADIGAAEGIWALNYVEKARKVYLFECDQKWIKALQKTFKPWKEKIVIVNKYVSNINDSKNVTLDNFFGDKRIDIIKADIEGMEILLLEGSNSILTNNSNLKLLLCTYHSKDDEVEIKKILEMYDFKVEFSKGYMIWTRGKELEKPYIRRGLVRAKRTVS